MTIKSKKKKQKVTRNGNIKINQPNWNFEIVILELGFGVRHVQALLMFCCLTVAYSMRVTMSVAIVAMTDKNGPPDKVMVCYVWFIEIKIKIH